MRGGSRILDVGRRAERAIERSFCGLFFAVRRSVFFLSRVASALLRSAVRQGDPSLAVACARGSHCAPFDRPARRFWEGYREKG
jgi:hypothetical protein